MSSRFPVVLVHGIWRTGEMRWLQRRFHAEGFQTYRPELRPVVRLAPLDELAERLEDYLRHVVGEPRFHLVGFSMGGVLCRHFAQRYPERIGCLCTISAPHHGSFLGKIFPRMGYRDFHPESSFMENLAQNDDALDDIPALSLRTPMDLMIIPSSSSKWKVAENRRFWVPVHPLMPRNKAVFREVHHYIRRWEEG